MDDERTPLTMTERQMMALIGKLADQGLALNDALELALEQPQTTQTLKAVVEAMRKATELAREAAALHAILLERRPLGQE